MFRKDISESQVVQSSSRFSVSFLQDSPLFDAGLQRKQTPTSAGDRP